MERSQKRHDFVNIYSYGIKTKVIYLSVEGKRAGIEHARVERVNFDGDSSSVSERLQNNISRARSRVQELALCNRWDYFVTFTLDPTKYDRYNLGKFREDLTQWIRNRRRVTGCEVKYLLIPEQHKDGAWHLHGLLSNLSDNDVRPFQLGEHLPYAILDQLKKGNQIYEIPGISRKFGWVTASPVRDPERCASYIVKYISKDVLSTSQGLESGEHLFYASRGLEGRKQIYSGPVSNAGEIPWGFENEYCKILWATPEQLHAIQLDPTFRRRKDGNSCND